MGKVLKIGWVLTREGIITRLQLEGIMAAQAVQPGRSVGELAADLFAIPEEVIESAFGDHILTHVIENWFRDELADKLPDLDLDTIVTAIEAKITNFTRSTIAQKQFVKEGGSPLYRGVQEKQYLFMVHCEVDTLTIRTTLGQEIVFHSLAVEYDLQTQRIKAVNTSVILEAKVRLIQLIRSQPKSGDLTPPS